MKIGFFLKRLIHFRYAKLIGRSIHAALFVRKFSSVGLSPCMDVFPTANKNTCYFVRFITIAKYRFVNRLQNMGL